MSMESTDRGFSLSVLELATLKGRTLRQCALRPDGRQLRLFLDGDGLLLVSAGTGEDGAPRLELDVVRIAGMGALAADRGTSPRRSPQHGAHRA
jgi:flagellar basal body rod protein FlgF